ERETELDLFIQQAIVPIFHNMILTAVRIFNEECYPPEAAYTDLNLSGEFHDYLRHAGQSGLLPALRLASLSTQYETFTSMHSLEDLKIQRLMEVTLREIREGVFAKEWAKEYADGYHRLRKLRKSHESHELWEWEQQALDMLYPFREDDE